MDQYILYIVPLYYVNEHCYCQLQTKGVIMYEGVVIVLMQVGYSSPAESGIVEDLELSVAAVRIYELVVSFCYYCKITSPCQACL